MLANNETGVIQPVTEIARIAREHGALFHCDGAQAAGRIVLDAAAIGADLVTLSAHKLGGPPGIGALVVTGGLELTPLLRGGGQESGRRAGTENLPGIAGFAGAAGAAAAQIAVYDRIRELRDSLEAGIAAIAPDAVVLGAAAPRLPNTAAVAMPGVSAETQVIALDLDGVIQRRAACPRARSARAMLQAMGGPDLVASTIRVSLGWTSSEADIAHFLEAWAALYRRCRGLARAARAA
jgi:cysteine desulfurase